MLRIRNILQLAKRRCSSALYITGDKAQTNFVVLVPYMNFEEQLQNREILEKNIEVRKLDIDLDAVGKRWSFFKLIEDQKQILEVTRSEIAKIFKKLKENPEENKKDIETLSLHAQLVKNDWLNVRDFSYGLEESVAIQILSLPNVLHPKTPIGDEVLIYSFKDRPEDNIESHLNENLIQYHSPMFCYLQSDAAIFEYALSNYLQNTYQNLDYIHCSNSDFVRSLIIDGCGNSFLNNSKIFTLEDQDDKIGELNRLHLVGGASLEAFMAYFTRHSVQPSYFPLKFFTFGRKYQPALEDNEKDLFNLCQVSVLKTFIALTDDPKELESTLDNVTKEIVNLYEQLGYHFKVVLLPADKLEVRESLRLSIQMYSNQYREYIQVGYLSVYDDYLSKRLLFTYQDANKERRFPKIIAGDVLNVHRFLGCALENNSVNKKPLLSELLNKYI